MRINFLGTLIESGVMEHEKNLFINESYTEPPKILVNVSFCFIAFLFFLRQAVFHGKLKKRG